MENLLMEFWANTGFALADYRYLVMILIGMVLIYLGIAKHYEPLLLVPNSARVVQMVGQEEDRNNFLLMHAMAPNVSGVIGSAIAAGVLWSFMM